MIRINKAIAASGYCSRRKADELITQGRVQVDGKFVTDLGTKIPETSTIAIDGKKIESDKLRALVMNKPKGYLTTMEDPFGRPIVSSLLPRMSEFLKPVGRLDRDSEGVLLFTNDGELAARLTHPKYHVEKEYWVTVKGIVSEEQLQKLQKGAWVEGRRARPDSVAISHVDHQKRTTRLQFILSEGRKREIRVMCDTVGLEVIVLRRVKFATLTVKGLQKGECRMLTKVEHNRLREMVSLKAI